MSTPEGEFDPRDSKYHTIEDLPEEHRDEFVVVPPTENSEEGFIRKPYNNITPEKAEAMARESNMRHSYAAEVRLSDPELHQRLKRMAESDEREAGATYDEWLAWQPEYIAKMSSEELETISKKLQNGLEQFEQRAPSYAQPGPGNWDGDRRDVWLRSAAEALRHRKLVTAEMDKRGLADESEMSETTIRDSDNAELEKRFASAQTYFDMLERQYWLYDDVTGENDKLVASTNKGDVSEKKRNLQVLMDEVSPRLSLLKDEMKRRNLNTELLRERDTARAETMARASDATRTIERDASQVGDVSRESRMRSRALHRELWASKTYDSSIADAESLSKLSFEQLNSRLTRALESLEYPSERLRNLDTEDLPPNVRDRVRDELEAILEANRIQVESIRNELEQRQSSAGK